MKFNLIQNIQGYTFFRDDLFPFLGGGNKGRKMNEIGKFVLSNSYNALVTTGGFQSNHCRAVAVFAAQNKMDCTLVLHGSKDSFLKQSGNAKIMRLSGAEIVFVNEPKEIGYEMDEAMHRYKKKNKKPFYIFGGGHNIEGGYAYVKAINELQRYKIKHNWEPKYIFLASGTGSTQSGILAGLDKFDFKNTKVIGVSVARKSSQAEKIVDELYKSLCVSYQISYTERTSIVLDDYLCGGYGSYDKNIEEVARTSVKNFGITLDCCYTAKAFHGMIDFMNKNNISKRDVLFWHTGGIFNFMAEANQ
ncbi:1-aminocyclopropane-1-carboxylate deaminase/D-cysteine desulfhydrase [Capnocytophaga cynodegmi]|uniref:1-aminocyclopropane-1-carboxylate deaminase/D-cysteine desulfhydrase n=1 Tax=Capnocytophaga cynodegmi TaxID=28189 RepID=UPI00385CE7D8